MPGNEVRCPNCNAKYAEYMDYGIIRIWCKRCRNEFTIDRREPARVG